MKRRTQLKQGRGGVRLGRDHLGTDLPAGEVRQAGGADNGQRFRHRVGAPQFLDQIGHRMVVLAGGGVGGHGGAAGGPGAQQGGRVGDVGAEQAD